MGYQRSQKHSGFAGSASYGVCVSRNLKCFGYQQVRLTTREGLPVTYERVPAHTDERATAETVLSVLWYGAVFGDKGFLGADWQRAQRETQGPHPRPSTPSAL